MPNALITGITGQDGSHLAEWLLARGYQVFGVVRPEGSRPDAVSDRIECLVANLDGGTDFAKILETAQPDEIYNLAAASFVPVSWREPVRTAELMTVGLTRFLEAVRTVCPGARFFQASSSEMFGKARQTPQSETTPFQPRSPYGIAKVYGHHMTGNYRESHGLFACSGILFNHEGPRRRLEFVTRKITHTAARIKLGLAGELRLGNLQARRDWGFAGDYVRAMWLMLQQETADDFVIGTGKLHTVEEFVRIAFGHLDLDWQRYVIVDPQFYRPTEPEILQADPSKAQRVLGWQPEVHFETLVRMMVDADLALLQKTIKPTAA
jgi:GDPmannose 4,6-dehydratase